MNKSPDHMPSSLWLRGSIRDSSRCRLICFSSAGGAASDFNHWAAMLPPEVEVIAVQLPGRQERYGEEPLTRIEPIIDALAEAVQSLPMIPCVFFGHSLGAAIAYELAVRLETDKGPAASAVVVSARGGPSQPSRFKAISELPTNEFVQTLRKLGGTSEEVLAHNTLLDTLAPMIRADFKVSESYSPASMHQLNCPIYPWGGELDPDVSEEELENWADFTNDIRPVQMYSGGHFYLKTHLADVIQNITAIVNSVVSTNSSS